MIQINVLVEDGGKLFGKQLVKANTVMSVNPAFSCPVIALRSTATQQKRGGGLSYESRWISAVEMNIALSDSG